MILDKRSRSHQEAGRCKNLINKNGNECSSRVSYSMFVRSDVEVFHQHPRINY